MSEKHFNLDEANQLLPEVKDLLELIRLAVDGFEAQRVSLGGSEQVPQPPPDTFVAWDYFRHVASFHAAMLRVREIGCQIKDVRKGLVDFPTVIDGAEACLCWQEGEDRIRFWHRAEDGFEGRKPLPEGAH